MSVPVNEFDGKVVYGRKNIEGSNNILTGHYRELLPTLNELKRLEKCAQGSFIELLKSGKDIFA
jgi:ATP-dependent RNA helicase DDX1